MSDKVNPVPAEYASVVPYLIVRNGQAAIDFYTKVFGAQEIFRLASPDGSIGHAELRLAGNVFMLADEVPDMDIKAPPTVGGSAVGLMIYVPDADLVFSSALAAGATIFKPICDQFYGDRCGTIEDPFGHRWTICTRVENVTPAEIKRRFMDIFGE